MPRAQPVLGYPSKSAAALALREEGLTDAQIGAKIGSASKSVSALIASARLSNKRKSAAANLPAQPPHSAGETSGREGWTEAKIEKALLLYPRIIEEVAGALKVPANELLALWVKGERPADNRTRRREINAKARPKAKHPPSPEARPLPAPATRPGSAPRPTSTANIEIRQGPVRRPESQQVRLLSGATFLNLDGSGTTRNRDHAWIGTRAQAIAMRRASPHARLMRIVPERPWSSGEPEAARLCRE